MDTEEQTTSFSLTGTLIDKCFSDENNGIKLFCFIDFQKVFDSVWHNGLLTKLILNKIGGRFFDLISAYLRQVYGDKRINFSSSDNHGKSDVSFSLSYLTLYLMNSRILHP